MPCARSAASSAASSLSAPLAVAVKRPPSQRAASTPLVGERPLSAAATLVGLPSGDAPLATLVDGDGLLTDTNDEDLLSPTETSVVRPFASALPGDDSLLVFNLFFMR